MGGGKCPSTRDDELTDARGRAVGEAPARILLLIKGLGLGGAERLLVDVVANRDRDRFEYEVAYVRNGLDALVPAMEATGVRVHSLGAKSSADVRWVRTLRRLLGGGRFDVLHSHLPYTAALARLAALSLPRESRPLLVYTEHSLWNKAAVLTKALNRATVGLDQALLAVSDSSRAALPPTLRARAQVVVHGVDLGRSRALLSRRRELRDRLRQALGIGDEEGVALTVANLREEKGYDVLIDAARLVSAEGVPVRFVSVGEGPLADQLRAQSEANGVEDKMIFLGRRTDALELMAGADLFVLPSHQEGLPVALMEAMSVGLPLVATTVGGVPDVVTDEVEGLLVAPGRPDLLARAVSRLVGDESLRSRLGQGALAASARFDVTAAVTQIEELYERLLRERHR